MTKPQWKLQRKVGRRWKSVPCGITRLNNGWISFRMLQEQPEGVYRIVKA